MRAMRRTAGRKRGRAQEPTQGPERTRKAKLGWFPYLSLETMRDDVKTLIRPAQERLGFVPNVFQTYAWRPDRLVKWHAHYDDIMRGASGLSRAEREMIAVVVSAENRCFYCMASHGAALRKLLGDPILGEQILLDYRKAPLDARTHAMLAYATKITRTPTECAEDDITRLRDLGFSAEDIWDIAETAAMFNYTNRMMNATGTIPNPEYHGMAR